MRFLRSALRSKKSNIELQVLQMTWHCRKTHRVITAKILTKGNFQMSQQINLTTKENSLQNAIQTPGSLTRSIAKKSEINFLKLLLECFVFETAVWFENKSTLTAVRRNI